MPKVSKCKECGHSRSQHLSQGCKSVTYYNGAQFKCTCWGFDYKKPKSFSP